ncbi:hypothetical protein BC830DRAFT_1163748 [Chytriomyces sp. MP71]|nr:hypothetical protein BC830DRAFT_1163748 [Chytriomyces sp. MP71]
MAAANHLEHFVSTPLDAILAGNDGSCRPVAVREKLLRVLDMAQRVPVYKAHLTGKTEFEAAPFLGKKELFTNAIAGLSHRCIDSDLSSLELIHVSSGSGGVPTFWGRGIQDELAIAARFEQIFKDAFRADQISTLAVVVLPMGSWVGGVFTTCCVRYLNQKGYKISTICPGNNPAEILRIVTSLSPSFQQTVLLGYPPFTKTVIDAGNAQGVSWPSYNMKFVFAGEVFSEEWRHLVAHRAGVTTPANDIVSIYGTADAGVLANETPLSATLRAILSSRPDLMRTLFGRDRCPSLMQFDPLNRYMEMHPVEGTVAVTTLPPPSGDLTMPLVRYAIGDAGGLLDFDAMMAFCQKAGLDVMTGLPQGAVVRRLPFVWVFGRAFWTVSLYGANVYVENVMVGLEQEAVHPHVTGKFVLAVNEDAEDVRLLVHVERAPGRDSALDDNRLCGLVVDSILTQLKRLNSEFTNYVPDDKQAPIVKLYAFGDAQYFPVGVKHSYILQ